MTVEAVMPSRMTRCPRRFTLRLPLGEAFRGCRPKADVPEIRGRGQAFRFLAKAPLPNHSRNASTESRIMYCPPPVSSRPTSLRAGPHFLNHVEAECCTRAVCWGRRLTDMLDESAEVATPLARTVRELGEPQVTSGLVEDAAQFGETARVAAIPRPQDRTITEATPRTAFPGPPPFTSHHTPQPDLPLQ